MENKKFFELTNPQKSIWYTEQYYNGTTVNNICTSGTVYGKIDENLLKEAINNVVKQNDSFRIHVVLDNNIAKQYIAEYKEFNIDVEYINDESQIESIEKDEVKYKFEVIDSDLFKFKLAISKNNFACIILTVNHLIADSWSLGLVIQEILRNYNSLKNNEEITQETFSYVDYINSEKEYKASKKFENDKAYWSEIFETIPEQATIPSLNNSIKDLSYNANRLSFEINKDLLSRINVFCRENNISIFNFFMAIFSIYIGRVSNIDDFVIGTPILNRSNFKEKHTTGMFVNTVPVRVNNLNDGSFKNLASNFATKMMGILRHQKYSYNSVLEDLREKNENVPNLYNIIISYQVTKAFNEKFGNYKTNWTFNNYCANDFNIHIYDINDTGDLIINYDYLIDKYSIEDVTDVHNRIINMINQILENNDINSIDIEIVTPEEKDKILNVFNNTKVDYPRDKTIVDLFEEQVEKTPDNVAVVFNDEKLTYRELNEKANSLANYLISQGVQPHTVIGLRLNKRLEMIIGILAIIKCGCCYLPINMQYPEDRVNYMLSDSSAKLLLGTQDSLTDMNFNLQNIDIDLNNSNIYNYDDKNLNLKISPEDLIYIIYTSGSTGKPKGAMLCHRNVVRLFKNDKFLFDFSENDVWTMFHSVAFDFSVWEMYGALLFGGKLVLVSDEIAQDPELFLNLMRKEHVTILNQTPTYFYKLLKVELERDDTDLSVRYIVFGGEALKPNLIKGWYLKYPETKLINMYGITETTVHVTFKELSELDLESPSSNIGVPIPTLHVIIVDKNLKLLPFGTIGEMCVLGEGVFKGYLNREDLNKTKLIHIPEYSDKLIYRSGDTAIMHRDGHLEYMGRIDTQVKIRGFRVELGEIEEKILKYSNIDTCIVTKKIDEFNRELLCAYYIKNGPLNISALRILLHKHLPAYMVPQYFIEIDKVPININGKTDFKALPLPQKAQTGTEMVHPRNDLDKRLLEIYEHYLHVNNVSMSDSFFDLGGDSLTAINISETISKEFNVEVTVKDILDKSIIMNLSDYISGLAVSDKKSFEIMPAEEAEFYPLSSAQKRIYYASKMIGDENIVYNIPGAILVDSVLDKEKVEKCFKKIIKTQSSFRTSFLMLNDSIVQKINKSVNFSVNTYENKSTEIDNLINSFPKAFNLENAPLLRVELHYLDNGKTLLLLESHHIIMDGTSLEILINEFCKLYNNENLENLNIEYKDFAVWENKYLESDMVKEAENYWVNKFKDSEIPAINLPYDFSIPSSRSYKGNTISRKISEKDFNKYITSAKKFGVSPYMFFLSTLFVLLYKYTGQEEIIIGSPVTGRRNNQLQDIIGMFVNNIAVDGKIDSSKKFAEFLNTIKQQVLNDLEYQDYPYNLLVKKLGLSNDSTNNPLFDVMFAYQNANSNKLTLGNESVEIIKSSSGISKFNLSIEIEPDTRVVNLEYRTDLFKESTIDRLFEHFINALNIISDNNDVLIKDISIISEEEKNKILYEFNDTKIDYPENKNLLNIFSDIVLQHSDNIAVSYKNTYLTYNELNNKSNYLANKLYSYGIRKGDVVGVCLNKSLELMVSIWAILKVGAVYMPMYVDYPEDRLNYMLENSNAKFLITNNNMLDNINFNINTELLNSYLDIKSCNHLEFNISINSNDLAYIIYTSGSTGRPKGVQISHKNLINYIYAFKKYFDNDITCNDNFLSSTNISFDVSIFELFLPLLNGSKLVLYEEEIIKNIVTYCDSILKNNITGLYIPPNILNEVYSILKDSSDIKISKLLVGVEPITKNTLNKYYKLNPNIKIVNGYGPTEATICSTALKYCLDNSNIDDVVSIGRPLYNNHIYILDSDKNLQAIGLTGELYITGAGVGRGYINNTTETNKNFLNNPFDCDSTKMYKTGDLAKWNSDGTINFIGRNDSQVKISGHRIELKEINYVIMQYPNITKSYTMIYKKGNNSYIMSYFVAETSINIRDLNTFIKTKLANYMIPNFISQLDSFPLTANGKIDKSQLPTDIIKQSKNYIAPRNDFEKNIIKIWEKLFLIEKIGIDDNFFELGGDSLSAIKFQIEAMNLGLNISYADIFAYPTPRKLFEKNPDKENEVTNTYKNYNFDKINKLLANNNLTNLSDIKPISRSSNIGNILLIGATGFLGSHILDNYLSTSSGIAYCLIRKKSLMDPEERLKKTLNFYFGSKYDSEFGKRIIVITGDITNPTFTLDNYNYQNLSTKVDIVINSAAIVKHYGDMKQFNDVNVLGTKYIIDFCKIFKKKLYYISTLSVSGSILLGQDNKNADYFKETDFYIGQNLNNVYIYTKFEAEKLIYEEIGNGLSACIFRIGNISNRYSDGKFQINTSENAFVNRIKAILKLGVIQNKLLEHSIEFTPVDICSDAIIKIIKSNPKFTVFHLFNNNLVRLDTLLANLNSLNIHIKPVSDEDFSKAITTFLNSESLRNDISGIITDLDKNKLLNLINNILPASDFTQSYLKLLGFSWPKIDINYINKYIQYFRDIKYLE